MKRRRIRHATRRAALRRLAAIDKAMSYPREATKRGKNCPPPPFGITQRWARPEKEGEEYFTPEVEDEFVGRTETVDGEDVEINNNDIVEIDP